MANYAKYTKGAMGHMLKHYERATDEHGEYLKFGNQDIDAARTGQNYNLAPKHDQLEFIHKRLNEVYCMKRKDVNVMCTWVVTAPKDLKPGQEAEFFKEAYSFLEKKYGKENVVSSYVHKDEKTPHMHFCFMPIVSDLKRNGYKVSAKECVTRTDLNQFHEQLQKHMTSKGIQCSIVNEATLEGNKSIKVLKRGTAQERVYRLALQNRQLKQELEGIQAQIEGIKAEYNKYAAMEALPAFMKLPAVKEAYQKFVKGLKKEDRPSIRKKLDSMQEQVDKKKEIPKLKKDQSQER